MAQAQTSGTIVQCVGAVIDIEFPRDSLPHVYDALVLEDAPGKTFAEKGLTFEVEQQLGDGVVRCIALGSSDGLRRGMQVKNTGAPISVPVGERTREGNDFYHEMIEAEVINTKNISESKVAMVFGQMNEPPGNRLRVGLTGLTMAEAFRDEGRDILLFIDNIYRFTLAGTEVSALLGRMPSAVGYQPTLAEEMGKLQERITSTKTGSITSVQAIYVPADDLTDPSPATTFAHLDATVVLSRDIASLGIFPAVDPLDSTSRQVDPN